MVFTTIVIFVKAIKILRSLEPKNVSLTKEMPTAVDYETAQRVQNELLQKGFSDVTVDSSTLPITLRGTIPKGKMEEVIQLAQEANGRKPIKNELIEK